jgi:hypothetical protein
MVLPAETMQAALGVATAGYVLDAWAILIAKPGRRRNDVPMNMNASTVAHAQLRTHSCASTSTHGCAQSGVLALSDL